MVLYLSRARRAIAHAGYFGLLFITAGCGSATKVGEVEGVLIIAGKPAPRIQIQFVPDIDRGTTGPISGTKTNSCGRSTGPISMALRFCFTATNRSVSTRLGKL